MRKPNGLRVLVPDLLADRLCVITGGGTGIGFETARVMFAAGACVVLLGRRAEVVAAACERLDPSGERAFAESCDIREAEQVEKVIGAIRAAHGPIAVLVNNAGGQFPSPAEAITPNGFAAVVRNNLLGTWNMTRAVATASMIPDGGGAIVNVIADIERGFPGMLHTGAARAGVDNMTKTLAVEWVSHGIRINSVAPGVILTEGLSQYPPELLDTARRKIPMKRLGNAEEVAHTIAFLCSDAASYITGVTLYIDGGARLWGETWPIADPGPEEDNDG